MAGSSPTPIANSAKTWTVQQANQALGRLLDATIAKEKAVAIRDGEIAKIQKKHAGAIDKEAAEISKIEAELELYYRARRAAKPELLDIEMAGGTIGVTTGTNPALVPLNDKWPWKKIGAKLRRQFKERFFHAPKPPEIDKVKVKKELTAEQLATFGLKLQHGETFYIELKRLEEAA